MLSAPLLNGVGVRVASMMSLLLHVIILALPNLYLEKKRIAKSNVIIRATLTQASNRAEIPEQPLQAVRQEIHKKSRSPKELSRTVSQTDIDSTFQSFSPDLPARKIIGSPISTANDSKNQPKENLLVHFASNILDRPPVPHSAPNPREYLTGTSIPALPINLRLYIDATGKVTKIEAKHLEYLDEALLVPVKDMFYATTFIPGNIKGMDVPSYIDIEVELSEFIR